MKFIKILFFVTIFIYGCSGGGPESNRESVTQYTIEQFMDTEQIFGSSFSPDESKILFTSKKSGIYNSYTVPAIGGETEQMTSSESDYAVAMSYFPDDERFLFRSDKGGNEITHIYLRDIDGSVTDLTPDSTAKAQFYGWAQDDKSLFFTTNKRDPKYFDLYEMSIGSTKETSEGNIFTSKLIFENNEFAIGEISSNKRYLALVKPITTNNNEMYLYDLESGESVHLSEHEGLATFSPQYFSRDDSKLFYTTNMDDEFSYLVGYDIQSGEWEVVEKTDWDIVFAGRSKNEKYRYVY